MIHPRGMQSDLSEPPALFCCIPPPPPVNIYKTSYLTTRETEDHQDNTKGQAAKGIVTGGGRDYFQTNWENTLIS
jgi:hypothetical protein